MIVEDNELDGFKLDVYAAKTADIQYGQATANIEIDDVIDVVGPDSDVNDVYLVVGPPGCRISIGILVYDNINIYGYVVKI